MSFFRKGRWQIQSVLVNTETVLNNEGFTRLDVSADEMVIQPAGLRFKVQQSTGQSAVLESRGRVFFADYVENGEDVELKLTRPDFDETINISAELEPAEVNEEPLKAKVAS